MDAFRLAAMASRRRTMFRGPPLAEKGKYRTALDLEVIEPPGPGRHGDGQVEDRPRLAGLVLGSQDPVGVRWP